jgi:hypothetical protein
LGGLEPVNPDRHGLVASLVRFAWGVRLAAGGTVTVGAVVAVDEVYGLVREIARTARPDRQVVVRIEPGPDGLTLLAVRERWTRTGLETDPLYSCESGGFGDEADMLRRVAGWFGLTNDWVTAKAGIEYWHDGRL